MSRELTEVRTVLSRARTALHQLKTVLPGCRARDHHGIYEPADVETAEMIEALKIAIAALEKWERG